MPALAEKSLKELRERRAELRVDAKKLLDDHGRAPGDYTEANKRQFDLALKEAGELDEQIKMREQYEKIAGEDLPEELRTKIATGGNGQVRGFKYDPQSVIFRSSAAMVYEPMKIQNDRDRLRASDVYRDAVIHAIAQGDKNVLQHVSRYLVKNAGECPDPAVSSADYSEGGWLTTPLQMLSQIIRCCDKMVKMRSLATIYTVTEACSLGVRKHTADMTAADWGEECQEPQCGVPTGHVKVLTPNILSACTALCRELLRKTSDNVSAYFIDSMARAMSYKMEEGYLYGDGIGKPLGLLSSDPAAISADRFKTFVTGTTFDGDDLIDVLCNIPDCMLGGNLAWLMSRAMWCAIFKLKTDYGYMWSMTSDRGLAASAPLVLLGYPTMISEFMNQYAPGQENAHGWIPLVFGDFSKYWIADRNGQLLESDLCVSKDRIAWYSRQWTDGMVICDEAFSGIIVEGDT